MMLLRWKRIELPSECREQDQLAAASARKEEEKKLTEISIMQEEAMKIVNQARSLLPNSG